MASATLPPNDTVGIAARLFDQITTKLSYKNFQVRFWDGSSWGASIGAKFHADPEESMVAAGVVSLAERVVGGRGVYLRRF